MSAVEQSLLFSFLLSLVPALACAAAPWPARRLSNWLLAGGLVAGVVVSLLAVVLALPPGVLGFLLTYTAVGVTQHGGWPLIPFITACLLFSAAVARVRSRVEGTVLAKRM